MGKGIDSQELIGRRADSAPDFPADFPLWGNEVFPEWHGTFYVIWLRTRWGDWS